MKSLPPYWLLGLMVMLIALRFLHFGEALDLPHDWRQADTAFYIWDFYQNGIDLLHPAVCWMGSQATLILEFPLPEAIVALIQTGLGESMWLSRLCFLIFFLLNCYYLFSITEFLFSRSLATWALIIYISLPLAQFYSRAIHIDFFAQTFAYGLFYYSLKSIKHRSTPLLFLASIFTLIAFLVKVPYAFFLAIPILVYTKQQKALGWLLRRALFFLVPLLGFWLWQQHVYAVNSAAPEWDYILHYRKFDDNNHWYFGTWGQRLSLYPWKVIILRVLLEAGGLFLLLFIPFVRSVTWPKRNMGILLSWIFGVIIYMLIFFNLNIFHNYYQIPFLAPIAITLAMGLQEMGNRYGKWLSIFGIILITATCTIYAECTYYEKTSELDEIAASIRSHTSPDDLPIVVYHDFDCRNPRILYRARRKGWSLQEEAAQANVIERLVLEEGATHLVIADNLLLVNQLTASILQINLQKIKVIPASNSTPEVFIFQLKPL